MRVLLADNHWGVRLALRTRLEMLDRAISVYEVTDTHLLFDVLEVVTPDVMLLDWELAGLRTTSQRRQLVKTVRARFPSIRIVVLSSSSEYQAQMLAAGVDPFVSKTTPLDDLLSLLSSTSF